MTPIGVSELDAPSIYVSVDPNPDNLTLENYYDGEPGIDYFGISPNAVTSRTVNGTPATEFLPLITLSGAVVVIIPLGAEFLLVIDDGSVFQESGLFEFVVDSLTF